MAESAIKHEEAIANDGIINRLKAPLPFHFNIIHTNIGIYDA